MLSQRKKEKTTTQILQSSKIQRKKATFGFGNIKKEETESRGGAGPVIRCVRRTLSEGGACSLKFRISGISNVVKFSKSADLPNIKAP